MWTALVAIAMTVALQPTAIAAADSAAGQREEELDEVIVKGNYLWQIRKAMKDTEDRFYARFNELNSANDFDMYCTRIPRRCLPVFYMDAMMKDASRRIADTFSGQSLPIALPSDAQIVWLERSVEYRQHALAVINNDRQLRALIHQREALDKRYKERRKEIFKDRWISW